MPFRHEFDQSLAFESAIAGAVFLIVVLTMAVALYVFRSRRAGAASQATEHTKVEVAYAAVLLAIAIVVIVITRQANAADNAADTGGTATPLTVKVTGFQWCWRFQYLNPAILVTGDCQNGTRPVLVVPAGRPVRFVTTSTDVIHSFWVPEFRFKMDAFPDHLNSFTMTVPHPGSWEGHCAEFCGERHAYMTFTLRALPAASYAAWSAAHATSAPTPAVTMGSM